jgi:decaprenyl-phosphate phosphoribosyltransferase
VTLSAVVRQARPRQWVKNLLVFAAAGAAGVLDDWRYLWPTLVMFVVFCLAASGTYYWNDIVDVEADRQHPTKRLRPIASGEISITAAKVIGTGLLVAAMGLSLAVWRWRAPIAVAAYIALTLSYTFWLRRLAVFDLVAVAGGFVLRAIGGAFATGVDMSTWFVLCTTFGSLFVVTGKRYAELRELGDAAVTTRQTMETYTLPFLRLVLSVACGATLVSYCVWAFQTAELSGSTFPWYELSIVPMLTALLRYTLVLETGHGGAPEEVFLQDRALQLCVVSWLIVFALGVYLDGGSPPA